MTGFDVLTGDEAKKFFESIKKTPEEEEALRSKTLTLYDKYTKDSKYKWDEAWGEISGFKKAGRDMEAYEWCCRLMFIKGLEWLDANPDAKPKQHGYKNVYGLSFNTNKDAEELEKHIIWASELLESGGPSGAQCQAVMGHLGFVAREGFEKWKQEMLSKK